MAGNKPTLFERLRGKRVSDIDLPAETPRDPRLPRPGKMNEIQQGIDKLRQMREYRKGVEDALKK